MKIRQLGAFDDLNGAIDLLCRFFKEEGFNSASNTVAVHTRQFAALETCGLFVAEEDEKVIGVATVSLEFGIEYGWWAEMGDLYVVPEWRGKRLSRELVRGVEEFLIARSVAGYQVTVTPFASEHHDLAQYYVGLGFESEGRLIMRKQL